MEFHSPCISPLSLIIVIETFAALAIAHVASDFVFQSRWIAENKAAAFPLAVHIAIVALTSWTALGFSALFAVLLLSAAHLGMDLVKSRHLKKSGLSYGIDQGFHLACILTFAVLEPDAWAQGFWAQMSGRDAGWVLMGGVLVMGAVYATRGGLFFVEHIATPKKCSGCRWRDLNGDAHRLATWQRAVIFLGMLIAPIPAVAVCAAYISLKLRQDRQNNLPIGTLSGALGSLLWAIIIGFGTHVTLSLLPTLDAARAGYYPLI